MCAGPHAPAGQGQAASAKGVYERGIGERHALRCPPVAHAATRPKGIMLVECAPRVMLVECVRVDKLRGAG